MHTLLIVLALLLAIVGIVGAVVPGLAGPPFSWAALLLIHLATEAYGLSLLIIFAVLAVIITIIDYVVPAWGTRRLGGSRAGSRGSTIGLIVSLVVLPLLGITIGPFGLIGLLAGPFVGAYIGETLTGNSHNALRSAIGSFVGFLSGTLLKLIFALVAFGLVIAALFS
ncbi:MAG: DUF456 domain-containing protein [Bacteroidales bacterium]|nr:DUF456 domain-containing protein [Bacteroidales bacterium]